VAMPFIESKWLTLLSFAYGGAMNGMLFMDFVSVSDLSAAAFGVTLVEVATTYSFGLLATLPMSFLWMYMLPKRSYWVFASGAVFNAVGAWLRWWSLVQGNWPVCMLSTVCIGVSFATFCMSFVVIGERWFPPEQQTFATSAAVQANYAGWCFAAFIIPTVVKTHADHERFMLAQAVAAAIGVVLFALCHDEGAAKAQPNETPSVCKNIQALCGYRSYWGKAASYAILGAVSYTIPAVQDAVLAQTLHVTPEFTKWSDVAFILSGVVSGLVLSAREPKRPKLLIKILFLVCAGALALSAALILPPAGRLPETLRRCMLVFAMAIAGASSLGFLGIALIQVSREAPGVAEAYSGGAVEWFVQAGGGLLSVVAVNTHGFLVCAVLVAAALAFLLGMDCLGAGSEDGNPSADDDLPGENASREEETETASEAETACA